MQDAFVIVRRQPSDYRTAKYLISSFESPHWDTVSGGIRITLFNQQFIYGYVQCTDAVEGEVAHSGEHGIDDHGPCPHRIKVCALRKDNEDVYGILLEMAGPNPNPKPSKPVQGSTCKKEIFSILADKQGMRGVALINKLLKMGYSESYIKAVLKRLSRNNQIILIQDPEDKRYNFYKIHK